MAVKNNSLGRFISKYHLDSAVASSKWKLNKETLSARFMTEDRTLLGEVKLNNFKCDAIDGETLGIYNTDQLVKLLSVLDDDVEVKYNFPYLHINDTKSKVSYVLSDLSIIPDAPTMKTAPNYDIELEMDNNFRNKFVKGKGALADVETFTLVKNGSADTINVIIGHSSIATNNCTIPVKTNNTEVPLMSFNAKYLKSIFTANRDAKECTMKVSSDGLARLSFKADDFSVEYYMVMVQN
jgi:hypothetical protein|tara:strand:- start:397 stop:1113 length:717 start_codon:yes stop_codon:yes gene_type:complete